MPRWIVKRRQWGLRRKTTAHRDRRYATEWQTVARLDTEADALKTAETLRADAISDAEFGIFHGGKCVKKL